MNDLLKQFLMLWRKIKLNHKTMLFLIIPMSLVFVVILLKNSYKSREQQENITNSVQREGSPNDSETAKGFALFDSNTWIKGEKELQVLEMRALKGQLEQDLCAFEQIKSASVILDIPPARVFNNSTPQKTKASVILALKSEERLKASQLKAVIFHLIGAVRGLEPHMIALSDTTGRLYNAINPSDTGSIPSTLFLEGELCDCVEDLFTKVVGSSHFFSNVKLTTEPLTAFITVCIDSSLFSTPEKREVFLTETQHQLTVLGQAEGVAVQPTIDFMTFQHPIIHTTSQKPDWWDNAFLLVACAVVLVVVASLFFPLHKWATKKTQRNEEDSLFKTMTKIDLNRLTASIKNEDPKRIAQIVSYLEPSRAEKLIVSFPENIQEQILFHLSEIENEDL